MWSEDSIEGIGESKIPQPHLSTNATQPFYIFQIARCQRSRPRRPLLSRRPQSRSSRRAAAHSRVCFIQVCPPRGWQQREVPHLALLCHEMKWMHISVQREVKKCLTKFSNVSGLVYALYWCTHSTGVRTL